MMSDLCYGNMPDEWDEMLGLMLEQLKYGWCNGNANNK